MNLFIMTVEDIIKHYKPKNGEEKHLLDALKFLYEDFYTIQEVLSDYSLCYDNAEFLNKELEEAFDHILELEEENEELKHEISYLKGDLDQLKKDF